MESPTKGNRCRQKRDGFLSLLERSEVLGRMMSPISLARQGDVEEECGASLWGLDAKTLKDVRCSWRKEGCGARAESMAAEDTPSPCRKTQQSVEGR